MASNPSPPSYGRFEGVYRHNLFTDYGCTNYYTQGVDYCPTDDKTLYKWHNMLHITHQFIVYSIRDDFLQAPFDSIIFQSQRTGLFYKFIENYRFEAIYDIDNYIKSHLTMSRFCINSAGEMDEKDWRSFTMIPAAIGDHPGAGFKTIAPGFAAIRLSQGSLSYSNSDFSHCDLRGLEFTGKCSILDISNSNFTDALIDGCNFQNNKMTSCKMQVLNSSLHQVDFTGANLDDTDFSGLTLSDVKFIGCSLIRANFSKCKFSNCSFIKANLSYSSFNSMQDASTIDFTSGTILAHVDFSESDLTLCKFDAIPIFITSTDPDHDVGHRTKFIRSKINWSLITGICNNLDLTNVQFADKQPTPEQWKPYGWDASNTKFPAAELNLITFKGYEFYNNHADPATVVSGPNFQNSSLDCYQFDSCKMDGTNFSQASLYRITLTNCSLVGANFTSAHCQKGDFTKSDMRNVNLSNTILSEATLDAVLLTGDVKIDKTDIGGAYFIAATLNQVNFSNAVDVHNVHFNKASCLNCNFSDFTGENTMSKCDFSQAKLQGASFSNSVLNDCHFSNSIFSLHSGQYTYSYNGHQESFQVKATKFDIANFNQCIWPNGSAGPSSNESIAEVLIGPKIVALQSSEKCDIPAFVNHMKQLFSSNAESGSHPTISNQIVTFLTDNVKDLVGHIKTDTDCVRLSDTISEDNDSVSSFHLSTADENQYYIEINYDSTTLSIYHFSVAASFPAMDDCTIDPTQPFCQPPDLNLLKSAHKNVESIKQAKDNLAQIQLQHAVHGQALPDTNHMYYIHCTLAHVCRQHKYAYIVQDGVRYEIIPHSEASLIHHIDITSCPQIRQRLQSSLKVHKSIKSGVEMKLDSHERNNLITHVTANPVPISAHYLSSWYIMTASTADSPKNQHSMALFGIHTPEHGRDYIQSLQTSISSLPPLAQLAKIVGWLEAAVSIIFHSTDIFTCYSSPDPTKDAVSIIKNIIANEPKVADLTNCIAGQGQSTPNHPYGFVTMINITDPATGEVIVRKDINGKPYNVQTMQYSSETIEATKLPLQVCIAKVRNEAKLEGWVWNVNQGTVPQVVHSNPVQIVKSTNHVTNNEIKSLDSNEAITIFTQSGDTSSKGISVYLKDAGQETTNRTFIFTVENQYARWVSVGIRFYDNQNQLINPDLYNVVRVSEDDNNFNDLKTLIKSTLLATPVSNLLITVFSSSSSPLTSDATFHVENQQISITDGNNEYYGFQNFFQGKHYICFVKYSKWEYTRIGGWGIDLWASLLDTRDHRLLAIVEGTDFFRQSIHSYSTQDVIITMPHDASSAEITMEGPGHGLGYPFSAPSWIYTAIMSWTLPTIMLIQQAKALKSSREARAVLKEKPPSKSTIELTGRKRVELEGSDVENNINGQLDAESETDNKKSGEETPLLIRRKNVKGSATVETKEHKTDNFTGLIIDKGKHAFNRANVGDEATSILLLGRMCMGLVLNDPAISIAITLDIATNKLLESAPFWGQIFMALSIALDISIIATTTAEVCLADARFTTRINETFTTNITICPDPLDVSFPAAARFIQVSVAFQTGLTHSTKIEPFQADGKVSSDPIIKTVSNLPSGGIYRVYVYFYTQDDNASTPIPQLTRPVGYGISCFIDSTTDQINSVRITIAEKPIQINENTHYSQTRKLGANSSTKKYEWLSGVTSESVPTATVNSLDLSSPNNNELAVLQKITFSQVGTSIVNGKEVRAGNIISSWKGGGQNINDYFAPGDSTNPITNLYAMRQFSSQEDPNKGLGISTAGFVDPCMAACELLPPELPNAEAIRQKYREKPDPGIPLWQQLGLQRRPINIFTQPSNDAKEGNPVYVRQVDLSSNFILNSEKSYLKFPSSVCDIAIHPNGYIVGIHSLVDIYHPAQSTAKLYIGKLVNVEAAVTITDSLVDMAKAYSGYGTRINLLQRPVAVQCTKDGAIIVLDAEAKCIQAFDTSGNPLYDYFTQGNATTRGTRALLKNYDYQAKFLDMSIEHIAGYIYILSYVSAGSADIKPDMYHIDIYNSDGSWLVDVLRIRHDHPQDSPFPAGRIAVDLFRNIYTQNYEKINGSNIVEPSISELIPSNSDPPTTVNHDPTATSYRSCDLYFSQGPPATYLTVVNDKFLFEGSQSFTISAIINPNLNDSDNNPEIQGNIFGRFDLNNNVAYSLFIKDSNLGFRRNDDTISSGDDNLIDDGEWVNVACTYDSNTKIMKIFINSREITKGESKSNIDDKTASVFIGSNWNPNKPAYDGKMKRIAVFNTCLTSAQLQQIQAFSLWDTKAWDSTIKSSLIAYFDFGLEIKDLSSNNIPIDLKDNASHLPHHLYSTRVLGFTKSVNDSIVDCGYYSDYDRLLSDNWTIEGYIYPEGKDSTGTIISKMYVTTDDNMGIANNTNGFRIALQEGQLICWIGSKHLLCSAINLLAQTWYHIAITYAGVSRKLTIYVNAVQYAACTLEATLDIDTMISSAHILIGGVLPNDDYDYIDHFEGYIQEIRYWKTCRTSEQISNCMQKLPFSHPDLIAYWSFMESENNYDTTGGHLFHVRTQSLFEELTLAIPINTEKRTLTILNKRLKQAYVPPKTSSFESYNSVYDAPPDSYKYLSGLLCVSATVLFTSSGVDISPYLTTDTIKSILSSLEVPALLWSIKTESQSTRSSSKISMLLQQLLQAILRSPELLTNMAVNSNLFTPVFVDWMNRFSMQLLLSLPFIQPLYDYIDKYSTALQDIPRSVITLSNYNTSNIVSDPELMNPIHIAFNSITIIPFRLSTAPSEAITVNVTVDRIGLVAVTPTQLVFTASNWNNSQKIRLRTIENDPFAAGTGRQVMLTLTASSASKNSIYDLIATHEMVLLMISNPAIVPYVDRLIPSNSTVYIYDSGLSLSFILSILQLQSNQFPLVITLSWNESEEPNPNQSYFILNPSTFTIDSSNTSMITTQVSVRNAVDRATSPTTTRSLIVTATVSSSANVVAINVPNVTLSTTTTKKLAEEVTIRSHDPGTGDCYSVLYHCEEEKSDGSRETSDLAVVIDGASKQSMDNNINDLPDKIDYVCCTHIDDDHINGLIRLAETYSSRIKQSASLWFNTLPDGIGSSLSLSPYFTLPKVLPMSVSHGRDLKTQWERNANKNIERITNNSKPIVFKTCSFIFKGPTETNLMAFEKGVKNSKLKGEIINRASIIFEFKFSENNNTVLFTGDAWDKAGVGRSECKQDINPGSNSYPDILTMMKVPHHGSGSNDKKSQRDRSEDENFFKHTLAFNYLISCSERHGLPTADVLSWIVKARRMHPTNAVSNAAPFNIYITCDGTGVRDFFRGAKYKSFLPTATSAPYKIFVLKSTNKYMEFKWNKGKLENTPESLGQVDAK